MLPLAIGVAALAGAILALVHAFLVITLRASQIVSGLALTIFAGAAGLSSYLGNDLELADLPANHAFHPANLFGLQDVAVVGPIVFGQTWLVYASWALRRSRRPLPVPHAAGAERARRRRVAAGRRCDGYQRRRATATPTPSRRRASPASAAPVQPRDHAAVDDDLTGGAGWIAIALVIFAFWRPDLCLVGAYFFGAFQALPFTLQARGVTIAPELFQALPYVMTLSCSCSSRRASPSGGSARPGALGVPYVREER